MIKDKNLLVITHLSQLLDYVTVIGGLITPLIIWVLKKDTVLHLDQQGKEIINFRISMFIYLLLCIPLILFFGLGLLGIFMIAIFYFIFPIINAIRVANNEEPHYPFSISFLR